MSFEITQLSPWSLSTLADLYKQVLDYGYKIEVHIRHPNGEYELRTYKEIKSFFGLITTKRYDKMYVMNGNSIISLRLRYM